MNNTLKLFVSSFLFNMLYSNIANVYAMQQTNVNYQNSQHEGVESALDNFKSAWALNGPSFSWGNVVNEEKIACLYHFLAKWLNAPSLIRKPNSSYYYKHAPYSELDRVLQDSYYDVAIALLLMQDAKNVFTHLDIYNKFTYSLRKILKLHIGHEKSQIEMLNTKRSDLKKEWNLFLNNPAMKRTNNEGDNNKINNMIRCMKNVLQPYFYGNPKCNSSTKLNNTYYALNKTSRVLVSEINDALEAMIDAQDFFLSSETYRQFTDQLKDIIKNYEQLQENQVNIIKSELRSLAKEWFVRRAIIIADPKNKEDSNKVTCMQFWMDNLLQPYSNSKLQSIANNTNIALRLMANVQNDCSPGAYERFTSQLRGILKITEIKN